MPALNQMKGVLILLVSISFLLTGTFSICGEKEVLEKRIVLDNLVSMRGRSELACTAVGFRNGPSSGIANTIRFWSIESGELIRIIEFPENDGAVYLDASPDGNLLACEVLNSASRDHPWGVACYSLTEMRWFWRKNWPKRFDEPERVKFTPDGQRIITAGLKYIVIYDAKSGEELERFSEPLKGYSGVGLTINGRVLSPTGRYLVVWQEKPLMPDHNIIGGLLINRWVTVWDLENRRQIARWRKPGYKNCSATFSPDEKNILFGSTDGYIRTWSIENREMIREWKIENQGFVDALIFSPKEYYLGVSVGNVKICEYSDARVIHQFKRAGFPNIVGGGYPMTFASDDKYFALGLDKRTKLCLYDTRTWERKWCIPSSVGAKD